MKRLTYAVALGLGLMMNACGSSNSNPAASTCTNQYGQTVAGTQVGNQCIASAGGGCTPCGNGGYMVPQYPGTCLPAAQAMPLCQQTGGYGTYPGYPYQQPGYGYPYQQPGYGAYPVYYGGGVHGCSYTAYGQQYCY